MAAQFAYQLNNNTAPEIYPVPSRRPQRAPRPTVVPQPKRPHRSPAERRALERKANVKVAKLFVVMALAIALLGAFCNSFVARTNSRQELENMKKVLSDYTDANVVLSHQLSKLISADNIDKIATQRLGLVKVASGDESYLELNEDNQVILSQSKN